jgi:hypothetical protein
MNIGGGIVGTILARSNMNDGSEKLKREPTNQEPQGSSPRTAAPENQAPKSGRLPLFRK